MASQSNYPVLQAIKNMGQNIKIDSETNLAELMEKLSTVQSALDGVSPIHQLISAYKTYGSDSYVYRDSEYWHKIMTSKEAINDTALFDAVISYANSNNILGEMLNKYVVNPVNIPSSIKNFNELCADLEALKNVRSVIETYKLLLKNSNFTNAITALVNNYSDNTISFTISQTDYNFSGSIPCNGKLLYLVKASINMKSADIANRNDNTLTVQTNGFTITKTVPYANPANVTLNHLADSNISISYVAKYVPTANTFYYKIIE